MVGRGRRRRDRRRERRPGCLPLVGLRRPNAVLGRGRGFRHNGRVRRGSVVRRCGLRHLGWDRRRRRAVDAEGGEHECGAGSAVREHGDPRQCRGEVGAEYGQRPAVRLCRRADGPLERRPPSGVGRGGLAEGRDRERSAAGVLAGPDQADPGKGQHPDELEWNVGLHPSPPPAACGDSSQPWRCARHGAAISRSAAVRSPRHHARPLRRTGQAFG